MVDTCPLVNLTGPLGVGKSHVVRHLDGAVVVDLDTPAGHTDLRRRLAQHDGVVVVDNADGRERLRAVRTALDATPGLRAVVVTRRPLRSLPGWSQAVPLSLSPLSDTVIDGLAVAAGIADPAAREVVVRMAAGVPLLAEAACRALHRGMSPGEEGPIADAVVAEILDRLGREMPGRRWRAALRLLATVGNADERLLRARPDQWDSLADLSVVRRESCGLAVAEPYRALFETAYRWRAPESHEAVRRRASAYRLGQLARATDERTRGALTAQALFLSGDPVLRQRLFPTRRPPVKIRPATPADAEVVIRLMRQWAVRGEFDLRRCDRLVHHWLDDDLAGFQVAEQGDDGVVGLVRLAPVTDRTVDGMEPLLQQHADPLLTEGAGGLFLGAAFCPRPAAHAQMLHHILRTALGHGRLLVSTATPDYQLILDTLRFRRHGEVREDVFHCGRPPEVYSNDFTVSALPNWLRAIQPGERDRTDDVAWALARLREPSALAASALLGTAGITTVRQLRERLVEAIDTLVHGSEPNDVEAGRILRAYYLDGNRTHLQVARRLHLSRATYFRRLRHGISAVASALARDALPPDSPFAAERPPA
nr:hypothetical protein GCM10020241_09110 [Streptoalloteichus tenebrarius]